MHLVRSSSDNLRKKDPKRYNYGDNPGQDHQGTPGKTTTNVMEYLTHASIDKTRN